MPTVELAVYDLSRGMAAVMSPQILGQRIDGIWHTGVLVFGFEYFFGGGIQVAPNGVFANQNQMPVTQILRIGETNKTRSDLDTFLNSIRHRFTAATYDLINHNCNNFSDVVCRFLTEDRAGVPTHIVDLPRIVFSTPGRAMLRPMFEGVSRQMTGAFNNGNGGGGTTSSSFEHHLSQNISSTISQTAQTSSAVSNSSSFISGNNNNNNNTSTMTVASSSTSSTYTFTPVSSDSEKATVQKLIDFVFTSNEASNVSGIGEKIAAHQILTDTEKEGIRELVGAILLLTQAASSSTDEINRTKALPAVGVSALYRVWNEVPTLQLSCLFLLRLVFLYPQSTLKAHLEPILNLLLDKLQMGSTVAFPSAATRTMGLSALVNYCSHPVGQSQALSASSVHLERVVDIATSGLTGTAEPTVRLMSAALACNLTLACTKEIITTSSDTGSGTVTTTNDDNVIVVDSSNCGIPVWHASHLVDQELPPLLVQMLCSALEALDAEVDATVRFRRLVLAARILSYSGPIAATLAADLGFADTVLGLLTGAVSLARPLSVDEKLLCRYIYGKTLP